MKGFYSKIFVLIILFLPVLSYSQYPWPVPNMYEQHKISGTLGEFRGFGRVLHEGVDVAEPVGTDVLTIAEATITDKGWQSIQIYEGLHYFNYIHIVPDPELEPGVQLPFNGGVYPNNFLPLDGGGLRWGWKIRLVAENRVFAKSLRFSEFPNACQYYKRKSLSLIYD